MDHRDNRWRAFGRALLFLIGCAFVLAVTAALPIVRRSSAPELVIGAIASVGCFLLTLLFTRWDGLRLRDVGAMPNFRSLALLAVGFALGFLLVALHSILVGAAGRVDWVRTSNPSTPQASLLIVGYLVLSTREELAFHGYPLRRLQSSFGVWPAQAMISVVFAIEHIAGGWTLAQALWGAAVGSLLFGMASIATRGLAVPVGIHAAWNIGDWMRGNRSQPGLWRPVIQAGFEDQAARVGVACYVALMAVATFCFWWWHRTREPVKKSRSGTDIAPN